MTFKVGNTLSAQSAPTLAALAALNYMHYIFLIESSARHEHQFSSAPICLWHRWRAISCTHGFRQELCRRFGFAWLQPPVAEARTCHLRGVPEEIQGGPGGCSPRSGIRWMPWDLVGHHHLAQWEKSKDAGCQGLASSWEHRWPRNLCKQTETCTILAPRNKLRLAQYHVSNPSNSMKNPKWLANYNACQNYETCQVKFAC